MPPFFQTTRPERLNKRNGKQNKQHNKLQGEIATMIIYLGVELIND